MSCLEPTVAAPARIAVLLPVYNSHGRLARTLASIEAQSPRCEIFVVDDGSDSPVQLPARIGEHLVRVIRFESNRGITSALNAGIRHILDPTHGPFDYVARHDAGDIDVPDRLARQVAFLEAHRDVHLVGASARFVDGSGHERFVFHAPHSDGAIRRKMRYSAAIVHSSCMFRMSALRSFCKYSQRYPYAEDYELFFRLMRHGKLANIDEVLVSAEYNPNGISIGKRRRSLMSRLRLQARFFSPISLHSYLGVMQTLALFAVPYGLVSRAKRALSPERVARA